MNNNKNERMLEGPILSSLLAFFFPILIGTFFQQLYNTVDAIIVGQFAGKEALSSVGGSSAIIVNLVVGFFSGLSGGCTVLVSQLFGARDKDGLQNSLHTSYAFAITGGLILGVICVLICPLILGWMDTPADLLDGSTTYLRLYFAGLPFVFVYNMGAGILRALGDSKRPLYYLIICTLVNVVFDLFFVMFLDMGVFGVALATLIAQAISAILVTECLMHRTEGIALIPQKIRFHMDLFRKMLHVGLPAGIQSSTYAFSNMFIQSAINLFGVNTVAGWTAEGKVDTIFWMINGSFGIAAATFVGQNFGANRLDRARKGTRMVLCIDLITSAILSALFFFFGRYPLWLFSKEADVIAVGAHMMQIIAPFYCAFVFVEVFSSSLRARGDTLFPTFINIGCIVIFRVVWISLYKGGDSLEQILYCYPISWIACGVVTTLYYLFRRRQELRRQAF